MAMTETPRGVNLNTLVTIGGFVVTIGVGVMVYGGERTENRLRHAESAAQIQALRDIQTALEQRLRATELMQASQSSDLRAIQSGVMRIEARLDKVLTSKSSDGNP